MFDQYYRDELTRLRVMAVDYADKEPELARHLVPGSDPDVERLLEGVAFLTAGLRDQLDREAPRFTRNLLEILDPTRLQALVSTTLIAFTPRGGLKTPLIIPAGTPLGNTPGQTSQIEFATSHACRVSPLEITGCSSSGQKSGSPTNRCLTLDFKTLAGGLGEILAGHPLSIHLIAPQAISADLYWLLLHDCKQVEVLLDQRPAPEVHCRITPLDAPLQSERLPGEAAMSSYLHHPEAAMAIQLHFDGMDEMSKTNQLSLNFWLDESRLPLPAIDRAYFRLHCVAASNCFTRQLPPFLHDERRLLQPLQPRKKQGEKLLVQSLLKVQGQYAGDTAQHNYLPYWEADDTRRAYAYQVQQEVDPLTGLPQPRLLLTRGRDLPSGQEEMIRVTALCSNGSDAAHLLPNDLSTHLHGTPETVDFSNITTSTAWKAPRLDAASERQQVAELSRGNASLFTRNGLLQRLQEMAERVSPDESRLAINQKKLDAIQQVNIRAAEKLLEQSLYRGLEVSLEISFQAFNSRGDALGFCSRLDRLLAQMAPINHFSALHVTDVASGESYLWPPKLNTSLLI